ncbi:MAG: glutamine amidotransferase, partial [Nitrospinaceae bacterium]
MNWTRWLGLEEYNAWEIQWVSPVPAWGLAALLGLAAVILWFFWTGLGRLRSPGKKALLVLLRAAVLGLLGCILMQPRLELKNIQPLRNIIAVLLDDSKSLGIKTFPGEVTRMEVVRRSLQNNREFLDALKERYQVDYFFVSDALDPVAASELETRYRPRGINTDFTQVFAELQTRYAGKSLQGVMLFSDGADLTQVEGALSPELSDLLVQLDGPVHALQAGGNAGFLDLGIETLEVSDFGFVYQPLRLSATVTAVGLGARRVSLVLREGGKIHTSRVVELKPGQERYEVELEFTPGVTGKRLFTLELPVFAGEAVEVNNKVHFQVNVVRDRIRVLHLNGRPSWDSRFLREMLINNPKVDLLSFFILRTLTDDVMATTSELSLIPFPSNLLFSDYLNSFDLVVFQNFKFKPFIDKRYLANIKKFVQAGGGFMMIGGDLSFQGGGYLRTPVEEILPVRLQRNSPWLLLEEVRPRIPPAAARHPILALEKDEALNREVWKTLPPLNGLNLGLQPAAGAQTLAGYQTRDGGELPVLVTAQV